MTKPEAKPRSILHIDMDAFFASVEVLDNPSLRGKPVLVGGRPEERGVVAAASYEARVFGVHSAMGSHRALQLCPHAVFLPPRGRRYRELSDQVFAIFDRYTPLVEPRSIDEAFLDLTGVERLFGPMADVARRIKRDIRAETGLTASAGLAPNKFLAKLASDLRKPDGFVVIGQAEAAEMIAPLPVGKIWGIGKVAEAALLRLGIETFRDLRETPAASLKSALGDGAEHWIELAFGRDDRPVEAGGEAKSIGAETTFAEDIADADELRRQLDALVERVARRLRADGGRARTINLKARYADFTTVTRAVTLRERVCGTGPIRRAARDLLEAKLGRGERALRLIGVSVSQLAFDGAGQMELFNDPRSEKGEALDRVMDRLAVKHGKKAVMRAAAAEEDDD